MLAHCQAQAVVEAAEVCQWEACDYAAAAQVYAEMEDDDLDAPARELLVNEIKDVLEAEEAWRVCVLEADEDFCVVEFEAEEALGVTIHTYSLNAEFLRIAGKGYAALVSRVVDSVSKWFMLSYCAVLVKVPWF
jgi:hypothetical protein